MDIGSIKGRLVLESDQFKREIESAKKETSDLGKKSKSTSAEIRNLGIAFTALGTAMSAMVVKAVNTASQFESSMARVRAITKATNEEFESLSNLAAKM